MRGFPTQVAELNSTPTSDHGPMDYESIYKFQQKEHRKTTTGMLNQQRGCNGNGDRWERKIPLHIGDEHSTRQWPGQSHFVADGDSWMDSLFLLEGNIFERPNDLATEFGGKWNRTTEQASDEEPKSKRQSLDLTDVGRRHQSGETRNVLRDDHSDNHVFFRKQYVDLMFSSLSIKGWDHDGTSCLPCHQIDLIKEPTCVYIASCKPSFRFKL
ncbi:unnamed protein product [Cylindrotheca closterium]|uniref:Uncharacterized protein n=1 Tax=Cylindrotheca closterium TaxID=2856 RepID=A0AAD2JME8_9STRA|nr:unnamed protein product [Cylindrotheca closterium]